MRKRTALPHHEDMLSDTRSQFDKNTQSGRKLEDASQWYENAKKCNLTSTENSHKICYWYLASAPASSCDGEVVLPC